MRELKDFRWENVPSVVDVFTCYITFIALVRQLVNGTRVYSCLYY